MTGLRLTEFNYELPEELIAQQPPPERGMSRLLVMNRATGTLQDDSFSNLGQRLRQGDLLVLNDSRVIPARLYARRTLRREKETPTGRIEVMLTEPVPQGGIAQTSTHLSQPGKENRAPTLHSTSGAWAGEHEPQRATANQWRALVRPGRKIAIGERLVFPAPDGSIALEAEVVERGAFGERLLEFAPVDESISGNFFSILDRIGHIPLPPYIHRDDATSDRDRYQTVFAHDPGSVAAPTAGLHFTPEVLAQLSSKGIEITRVTLHVGLGTFVPLRVERVDEVRLHRERYTISAEAAAAINTAAAEQRRIVAVGTTTVRTLESAALAAAGTPIQPHSGATEIFISPGFQFRLVSALLTNFHLPQSSLLMLVSAFAGREQILAAYQHAVEQNYRFFSYGDCMFIA
jgi:S-adenosylmethionine:tRNA ribosyltransferase-isomerase